MWFVSEASGRPQSAQNPRNHRMLYVAVVLVGALIVGSSAAVYFSRTQAEQPQVMMGTMFVSDAGRSHGGFEYTASWNATLSLKLGNQGSLQLVLNLGLGDALTEHNFTVTDFSRNSTTASMNIDGRPVTMRWVTNDSVWNQTYDRYYIASWGSDAPPNEIIGRISPTIFPGLNSFWYIELRLH